MGTNLYILDEHAPHRRGRHVGKRYAKGVWCWDCKKLASTIPHPKLQQWVCFYCGAKKTADANTFNPAMREMGLDLTAPVIRTGIDGAMGFVWALGDNGIEAKSVKAAKEIVEATTTFLNEYGDKLTLKDIHDILSECIDEEFSFELFS